MAILSVVNVVEDCKECVVKLLARVPGVLHFKIVTE